jgi:hypothetical protein
MGTIAQKTANIRGFYLAHNTLLGSVATVIYSGGNSHKKFQQALE